MTFLLDLPNQIVYDAAALGVDVSRWAPRSSKSVVGAAEAATVGSTPIHSRLLFHHFRRVAAPPRSHAAMNDPVQFVIEEEPPRFLRAQALPYPELKRVWARVELTAIASRPGPELEMAILDPDGREAAAMVMVDVQHSYVSLTMHLKQPLPGQPYQLLLRLTRDDMLLDQRAVPFDLVFVERDEAKAEAEALTWTERAAPISPLHDESTLVHTNGAE